MERHFSDLRGLKRLDNITVRVAEQKVKFEKQAWN